MMTKDQKTIRFVPADSSFRVPEVREELLVIYHNGKRIGATTAPAYVPKE